MIALPCPVEYLVYRPEVGIELPTGKAYGYALAGNGVFKFAANAHFTACIPVGSCRVSGLAELKFPFRMRQRLPVEVLRAVLADARRQAMDAPREAMYHVVWDEGRVEVVAPEQEATMAAVRYTGGDSANVILDIHSHCELGAFFSQTDNRDEQGLRLYGVIGRIFTRPEVKLRVGVYGDFWPVDVGDVFELGFRR